MSDKSGPESPFAAFSAAFPQSMSSLPGASPENWQKMWSMFMPPAPGGSASPLGGMSPSLSMMSELIAPLTNVDELDKRITDMRAVEHWLKLNLQMLQSTTQALEVQRATLATLRAFGAMGGPAGATAAGSAGTGAAAAPGAAIPQALDPTLWWGAINEQFKQLAAAATAATKPPGGPAAAAKPAPSTSTAGAAKSTTGTTAAAAAAKGRAAPARKKT